MAEVKTVDNRNYLTTALASDRVETTSRFMSLEAFRGLAAVMIVLYHSRFYAGESYVSFVRNSDIFVDFFFILSGFVMAHSYLDKIGSKISFRKFVLLRFGRLYPLHILTLLLWVPYIAVKVIFYEKGLGDTDPAASNNAFTFLSNVLLFQALDGYQPLSWNYPSWSISAEFYTYIFFFIFVVIAFGRRSSGAYSLPGVILVASAAYAFTWILDVGRGLELFIFECIGGFFLGILIYILYKNVKCIAIRPLWATVLEVTALAFLVYCVSNKQDHGFRDNVFFYVSLLSFSVVIYLFVVQEGGYISRFLKNRLFQFIGKLSYSIYMVHAIVLAGIENLFVYVFKYNKTSFSDVENMIVFEEANYINFALIVVVIFLSAFTYRYVEIPWRERFRKLAEKY